MRAFDRILLSTHLITYLSSQIEHIREQLNMTGDETCERIAGRHAAFLLDLSDKLHDLAEDAGNYLNGNDGAEEDDYDATAGAFGLLQKSREVHECLDTE